MVLNISCMILPYPFGDGFSCSVIRTIVYNNDFGCYSSVKFDLPYLFQNIDDCILLVERWDYY